MHGSLECSWNIVGERSEEQNIKVHFNINRLFAVNIPTRYLQLIYGDIKMQPRKWWKFN